MSERMDSNGKAEAPREVVFGKVMPMAPEAIREVAGAVLSIVNADAAESTKRIALEALRKGIQPPSFGVLDIHHNIVGSVSSAAAQVAERLWSRVGDAPAEQPAPAAAERRWRRVYPAGDAAPEQPAPAAPVKSASARAAKGWETRRKNAARLARKAKRGRS